MFCALDMAITCRFLGFVNEVIGFRPSSRTLRVLMMRPARSASHSEEEEFAAVFFAPGVRGVAIALWATNLPNGAPMPKALLGALKVSSKKFLEVTAPDEIQRTLTALRAALEEELRGTPKVTLMLTASFAGTAFDLAATATASTHMPLNGDWSLANYLAAFPTNRKEPARGPPVHVPDSDASFAPMPRQLR
jgi:hypothetical protein